MRYTYAHYVPVYKALCDETRLKIIDMLSCGEMCACEVLEKLSISQSTLSYHMKILIESGLVKGTKDGSWMRYTLNKDEAEDVMNFFSHIFNEKEECICK